MAVSAVASSTAEGGVRDGDSARFGSVNIDLIVSGTIVADRLERGRESVDEISVENANLVGRVVVTVNGDNVGVLAAGRAGLGRTRSAMVCRGAAETKEKNEESVRVYYH